MNHRFTRSRKPWIAAAGVLVAAGVTFGGIAAFAGTNDPTYTSESPGVHACVARDGSSRLLNGAIYLDTSAHVGCPNGYAKIEWTKNGVGPAGPTGPQGPAGDSAVLSVSATTAVSNWPEGSGWATDQFVRSLTVTRQSAAPSSACGGAPTCWFYTGTLADTGSFTTADGAKAPNGDGKTIAGTVTGSIVGGAQIEFYASSDSPNPKTVPATADGATKPASTSDWYKLAFPDGTTFAGGKLTGYTWTYTAPATCETWKDAVNPGDDGQSEADGNITGVNACH